MKIDFHCHTKKVKAGDADTRNVTPKIFKDKIEEANVKIVAITNHNCFDIDQYIELKDIVKGTCYVWPGIELDVTGSSKKRGHLIVISNPDNVAAFNSTFLDVLKGKDVDSILFDLKELYEITKDLDVIYIFHVHKKPCVDEEDIDSLRSLVLDDSRIFSETTDDRSLGVFANNGYNVMIGSDVRDWNVYEKSTFAEMRLPVSNFNQFCKLAKRDPTVIKTLLNEKRSYEVVAHPYKRIDLSLNIFADINIIFGQKGTGKSEILKTMYEDLSRQGLGCEKFDANEGDLEFSNFTKTNDMSRKMMEVDADECLDEFDFLFKSHDDKITLLSNYFDWYKTKDNNKNKSRMKVTEARSFPRFNTQKYDLYKEAREKSNIIKKSLHEINLEEFINISERKELERLLGLLEKSIYDKFLSEAIEKEAIYLADFSVSKIKATADKNSNTKSRPSDTGFSSFADLRIKIKKNVNRIIDNITNKESFERVAIGSIENKGTIYIQSRYRTLCESSKTQEFRLGIRVLRDIKEQLILIQDNWFNNDILLELLKLKQSCDDEKLKSANEFLGLSKQIVSVDDEEYTPSSGEKSMLLIQKFLKLEADAYFLDEPELGMGNSYIDSTIRPQLMALAKQGKIVVVATHNANIAVRTLPYVSIFRVHENGNYLTYVGNPFNNQLENVEVSGDTRNWTKESMHTLEGGKTAFYERKDIYETGRN